jgi:N6-adenosine-specific RNA methylase IME4
MRIRRRKSSRAAPSASPAWPTIASCSSGQRPASGDRDPVLELQGFRYVTSLVWNKERPGAARGPGYWFTGEHEIVLVGVRGKVVPPAFAHFRSNFSAPVGAHSEKPTTCTTIIEFHWPTTPKGGIQRAPRAGLAGRLFAWGFDAPASH